MIPLVIQSETLTAPLTREGQKRRTVTTRGDQKSVVGHDARRPRNHIPVPSLARVGKGRTNTMRQLHQRSCTQVAGIAPVQPGIGQIPHERLDALVLASRKVMICCCQRHCTRLHAIATRRTVMMQISRIYWKATSKKTLSRVLVLPKNRPLLARQRIGSSRDRALHCRRRRLRHHCRQRKVHRRRLGRHLLVAASLE